MIRGRRMRFIRPLWPPLQTVAGTPTGPFTSRVRGIGAEHRAEHGRSRPDVEAAAGGIGPSRPARSVRAVVGGTDRQRREDPAARGLSLDRPWLRRQPGQDGVLYCPRRDRFDNPAVYEQRDRNGGAVGHAERRADRGNRCQLARCRPRRGRPQPPSSERDPAWHHLSAVAFILGSLRLSRAEAGGTTNRSHLSRLAAGSPGVACPTVAADPFDGCCGGGGRQCKAAHLGVADVAVPASRGAKASATRPRLTVLVPMAGFGFRGAAATAVLPMAQHTGHGLCRAQRGASGCQARSWTAEDPRFFRIVRGWRMCGIRGRETHSRLVLSAIAREVNLAGCPSPYSLGITLADSATTGCSCWKL
jgi:hypothetical protein